MDLGNSISRKIKIGTLWSRIFDGHGYKTSVTDIRETMTVYFHIVHTYMYEQSTYIKILCVWVEYLSMKYLM